MSRVGRKIRTTYHPKWDGGTIVRDYPNTTPPGAAVLSPIDGIGEGLLWDTEFELEPENVPASPAIVWNGPPITVDPTLNENEWHYTTITYNGEKYAVGASAPAGTDCTCESLLHGHLDGCPYPRRSANG